MEETGCEIICGALKTLVIEGQMMIMMLMLLKLAHYYGNSGQTCKYIRSRSTFFERSVILALQEAFRCYGCVDFAYGASHALTRQLESCTVELSG